MMTARLLWRNLNRNRRRSLVTVVAIALAAFTYSCLSGLPFLVNRLLSTPASSRRVIVTNKSGFFYSLPLSYRAKILALPHIVAVSSFVFFGGIYRNPSDQLGIGVDPQQAELMWPDWGMTTARADKFRKGRTGCLVPVPMMRKYGWHVGQQIVLRGTAVPVDLTLKIADTLGDRAPPDMLMLRRDYLESVLGTEGRTNAYQVMVDSEKMIPTVIASIDETFANSSAETHSASEATWFASFIRLDLLFMMLEAVAASVVIAISLLALNTALMAMRERVHEIAIMRAIGFSPNFILRVATLETASLGLGGAVMGCAAALILTRTVPASILPLGPLDLIAIIPARVLFQAFLLSVGIGALAGASSALAPAFGTIVEKLRAVV